MIDVHKDICLWLANPDGPARTRVLVFGKLTGWRKFSDGSFGAPNFERALVLDRIVRAVKPAKVLEIGTGRGLGCLTMAAVAEDLEINTQITTIDFFPADRKVDWPAEIGGKNQVLNCSRTEVWTENFPAAVTGRIEQLAGNTERMLPRLLASGGKFDFIFVDAGHDLYSVVHDLSFAVAMLAPGGLILMDDFAPEEEYGLGTCMIIQHARRLFERADVFVTEGLVYGDEENPDFRRGMVLLQGLRKPLPRLKKTSLIFWRIFNRLFRWAYFSSTLFPVR